MFFKRKVYDKLLDWKKNDADRYSVLLEGARRVGKSTIVEEFAKNEYASYIIIDFANVRRDVLDCFDDIADLDIFFIRLQAATGTSLVKGESVIVFDEIQLFPRARQAIKYLVKDGRYHYIETGSLISIKKNVKDILVPSEEKRIQVHPMDYEEFLWAADSDIYDVTRELFISGKSVGQSLNRKLMRDFRKYMAIGGMPQAVAAYVDGRNFSEIDDIKRSIIDLYEADFKKIDSAGRIFAMYKSIPAQLSRGIRRYTVSRATGKRKTSKDEELIYDLIDSKTVNISYNTTDPRVSLSATRDINSYKMYVADTGLFVTLLMSDRSTTEENIYTKMLSDKLPANLGYLYENIVAQMITSFDRELYYHTWNKKNSSHYYEVDFLISRGHKVDAIEVKSSGVGKHASISEFKRVFSKNVGETIILSQKDISEIDGHQNYPIYMTPYLL